MATNDPSPDDAPTIAGRGRGRVLLIACGALAREMVHLVRANGWDHMDIACIPAKLHNRPQLIPGVVQAKILESRPKYDRIYAALADCGTGGRLDAVLEAEGVERMPGPHCYAFYAGQERFQAWMDDDPCVFFLTDYLVRHFDRLVIQGLGLDRFPELRDDYFGHYERLVYLAQTKDPALEAKAREAAERLGLRYEYEFVGYGELESFMAAAH